MDKKSKLTELIGELHTKFDHPSKNSNLRYAGFSIYREKKVKDPKKGKDSFTVVQSASIYINKSQFLKSSYNSFNGYVFHSVQGTKEGEEISGKNFDYLKLFFKDIDSADNCYNIFFRFKLFKKHYLQIIFIYKNKPTNTLNSEEIKRVVKKINNKALRRPIKKTTDITLPATRTIKNASLIILDLIRDTKRKDYKQLLYADASITRKMIFDIAEIVVVYGFFIAGHTGDGFFFIREHKDSDYTVTIKEAEAILHEIEEYLTKSTLFFGSINHFVLNHRVRLLIDTVETIFEMNDTDSMAKKLYFSPRLDESFDKMRHTAKHDQKHLLILDGDYKTIEWVSSSFEVKKEDQC